MVDLFNANTVFNTLRQRIATTPRPDLDRLASEVWALYGTGHLGDHEAQSLADAIQGRRRGPLRAIRPALAPMRRARTERRCTLAHSLFVPPQIKARFTIAELAVLRIIADEVSDHGRCDRTIGEVAARAGVGRTSAQNAIRRARQMGLIAVEERRQSYDRSLPNRITIISREWLQWLRLRQRRARPHQADRKGWVQTGELLTDQQKGLRPGLKQSNIIPSPGPYTYSGG